MKKNKVLAPGIWLDHEGGLHFSAPDILKTVGLPDTDENRAIVIKAAREFVAENRPGMEMRVQRTPKAWDAWWPDAGPCAFCGVNDSRHRIWDAIVTRTLAGDSPGLLAVDYGVPMQAIEAVLAGWLRTDRGCR